MTDEEMTKHAIKVSDTLESVYELYNKAICPIEGPVPDLVNHIFKPIMILLISVIGHSCRNFNEASSEVKVTREDIFEIFMNQTAGYLSQINSKINEKTCH